VIEEGYDNLIPAGKTTVCLHGNKISQPGDILDLLLLKLEIGVEAAVVELFLEGHGESLD